MTLIVIISTLFSLSLVLSWLSFTSSMAVDEHHKHRMSLVEYAKDHTILCFGDSLTYGLVREGSDAFSSNTLQHPYANRLSEKLGKSINVVHSGIPGETVQQMISRLPHVLQKTSDVRVVVILGGTNDLGHRFDVNKIFMNIKRLHEIALSSSKSTISSDVQSEQIPVYTIAVTIPQSGWAVQNNLQERIELNEKIREFAKSCNRIRLLELESTFDQTVPENDKYWSIDRLHFSALGYDGVGELVFEKLQSATVAHNHDTTDSCLLI